MLLLFAIFGSVLLHTSFKMSLEQERDRSLEEARIFQYAFLASLKGLPEDYNVSDMTVAEIVKLMERETVSGQNSVVVYNQDKNVIYGNMEYESTLPAVDDNGYSGMWQLTEQKGIHYLEMLYQVKSSADTYYLAMSRNVQSVYDDRDVLYQKYVITMLVVMLLSVGISFLFSMSVARPLHRLSGATRDFSNGNYTTRVTVTGNDELSALMEDFNGMAEQIEQDIYVLSDTARRQKEFTGAFAHELKTPLTAIIGYAQMLRSMELSKEELRESADYIYRQGRRLERLAYRMLELSRIDNQAVEFRKLAVSALTDKIKALVSPLLKSRDVELNCDMEEGYIYGEEDLIISLISNLIDNGAKACRKDGVVCLSGKCEETGYVLKIADNGCGMAQEELGKITEAFYMVDKSRAREDGGAGLGLTLCNRIVELHHAVWEFASSVGAGTTVTLRFIKRGEQDE